MQHSTPYSIFNTPEPKSNQRSVLNLRCKPIEKVRIAFIGLGMRTKSALNRYAHIDNTEIKAICDIVPEKCNHASSVLNLYGISSVDVYQNENDWRAICQRNDIDLIYISTHYQLHTPIAIYAMQHGKHVAIEVPAAVTVQECWQLVDTAEQTQRHCMMLENCNYGSFELTTLNMAQQGVFGEVIHGEGAYIHDLKKLILDTDAYWDMWRLKFHAQKNGNLYPTHGLGPLCHIMNIHRGDKLSYLTSTSTKQFGMQEFINENYDNNHEFTTLNYSGGDMNTSLIKTARGKTIMLQHDITSPRPYNRIHLISGTKGFAQKWPKTGIALAPNGLEYVAEDKLQEMLELYKHPVQRQMETVLESIDKQIPEISKNDSMDYIMDYRLIYCLRNGLPLDQDVYDAAEWSSVMELSEYSANNFSTPVEIPDFTRGNYKQTDNIVYHI
ncbi:MAG: Gfo/Idh/MocA family oxidoreductase [Bacteroidales bacterium]|jgi:predicted dehydrogenase|nr:Gfo/Idh/MocA family oxidoreductase [Bacteroidales bacterium]